MISEQVSSRQNIAILLGFLLLICAISFRFGEAIYQLDYLFDSDEYAHAGPALDFAILAERGNWSKLLDRFLAESAYPPLHPTLLSLFFALCGASLFTARFFCFFLFLLATALIFLATYHFARKTKTAPPVLAATLSAGTFVSSPLALLNSSICMIESLGILVCSAMLLVFSTTKSSNEVSWQRYLIFSALFTALFFTKYTFLVLIIPGFLSAYILNFDKQSDWKHFFWPLLLVFVPFALLASLWLIFCDWNAFQAYVIDYPLRGYLLGIETFPFYIEAIFSKYFLHPGVSLLVFPLLVYSGLRFSKHFSVLFALFAVIWSCLLFGIVAERLARHILPILPFLCFPAGLALAELFQRVRTSFNLRLASSFSCSALLIASSFFLFSSPYIKSEVAKIMEYRGEASDFTRQLARDLPADGSYAISQPRYLPFLYFLNWELARKGSLTIEETNSLRKKLAPQTRKDIHRIIAHGSPEESLAFLRRLRSEEELDYLVLVDRADASREAVTSRTEKLFCADKCSYFQPGDFEYLILPLNKVSLKSSSHAQGVQ